MIPLAYLALSIASYIFSVRVSNLAFINTGTVKREPPQIDILFAVAVALATWSLKTIFA